MKVTVEGAYILEEQRAKNKVGYNNAAEEAAELVCGCGKNEKRIKNEKRETIYIRAHIDTHTHIYK